MRNYIAAATTLALIAVAAGAQQTVRVTVAPQSKLWIEGTSNLHGWSCAAKKFDAAIDLDSAAATRLAVAPPEALARVEVKVPVRSLDCGHGGMNDNLYKALNADASAEIGYILATFNAVPGATADSFVVHTVGTLTVSGKSNRLPLDVVATRAGDGTVEATGTVAIRMTDYGIKPPTAIFGRLKTGDEIKVHFDLTLTGRAIATALGNP